MRELSKGRTRDLLMNYKRWAWDCPPDYAEVHYYVVCPDFVDIIKWGSKPPYDEPAALMVEEVLREMYKPYPREYRVLQAFYGEGMALEDIGKELGISRQSVSKYRLPMAEKIFAEQWALLVSGS